jgi:hypothetical protein
LVLPLPRLCGHPDVDERLDGKPDRDSPGEQHAELVVRAGRDQESADDDNAEQRDDHGRAGEAELLPAAVKNEVGVLPNAAALRSS